jgi:hypothetical protein
MSKLNLAVSLASLVWWHITLFQLISNSINLIQSCLMLAFIWLSIGIQNPQQVFQEPFLAQPSIKTIIHSSSSWPLVTMKNCKSWDNDGINHLPSGVGFLPSTVSLLCFLIRFGQSYSHPLAVIFSRVNLIWHLGNLQFWRGNINESTTNGGSSNVAICWAC